jgi:hypothetical protein
MEIDPGDVTLNPHEVPMDRCLIGYPEAHVGIPDWLRVNLYLYAGAGDVLD